MSSSNVGDVNLGDQLQQGQQTVITAFLAKLWALVNDPTCDDLICWDSTGNSFHVYDQSRFAREILPRYFKHNNFASFIRQLNMYGFRKLSTIEQGSLKNERDDIEFAHPNFVRGQEALLEFIKRRASENQQKVSVQPIKNEPTRPSSSTINVENKSVRAFEFGHLLDDVRNLQSKQTSLTDKLFHLEDENQALWREIGTLRQKHNKQQQIVSKLMEFLLHILTNSSRNHRRSVAESSSNSTEDNCSTSSTIGPSHSLKRKQAALMLSDEPQKRINRQNEKITIDPNSLFIDLTSKNPQKQRITINELSESDPTVWNSTNDDPPFIDFVPSPPTTVSSIQKHLENFPSTNKYDWIQPIEHDSFTNLPNNSDPNETFLPDFFLTPEQDQDQQNHEQILNGIDTSNNGQLKSLTDGKKQEQSESPMVNQQDQLHSSGSLGFSLDEFSGHVDNIQTSLDNIRDFMFNKIPDETMIEDLFNDDHVLLSPLLPTPSNLLNEQIVENPSQENFEFFSANSNQNEVVPAPTTISTEPEIILDEDKSNKIDSNSSSSDSSNKLLQQLIRQNKTIEHQQKNQIEKLESENFKLQRRLNVLDRQTKK